MVAAGRAEAATFDAGSAPPALRRNVGVQKARSCEIYGTACGGIAAEQRINLLIGQQSSNGFKEFDQIGGVLRAGFLPANKSRGNISAGTCAASSSKFAALGFEIAIMSGGLAREFGLISTVIVMACPFPE
jgi:hypothetical protein